MSAGRQRRKIHQTIGENGTEVKEKQGQANLPTALYRPAISKP